MKFFCLNIENISISSSSSLAFSRARDVVSCHKSHENDDNTNSSHRSAVR